MVAPITATSQVDLRGYARLVTFTSYAAIHLQRLPKQLAIVLSMLCDALMIGSLHLDDELHDNVSVCSINGRVCPWS